MRSSRTGMLSNRAGRTGGRYYARRSLWLPAASYYVLAAAVSVTMFFLIWGLLEDGADDSPWIGSGLAAGTLLIVSVLLREIVLRRARMRYLARRRLEKNLNRLPNPFAGRAHSRKLSFRRNELLLSHIQQKSDAARVLNQLADGHREVFEICNEYLNVTARELRRTDVHSPRYSAMRKGRRRVKPLHKYHLLLWSEIESKALSRSAKSKMTADEKVETARRAIDILESAIGFYPTEDQLIDSVAALKEFTSTIAIADRIDMAETESAEGRLDDALGRYEQILAGLPEEHLTGSDRTILEEKLEKTIRELRKQIRV